MSDYLRPAAEYIKEIIPGEICLCARNTEKTAKGSYVMILQDVKMGGLICILQDGILKNVPLLSLVRLNG